MIKEIMGKNYNLSYHFTCEVLTQRLNHLRQYLNSVFIITDKHKGLIAQLPKAIQITLQLIQKYQFSFFKEIQCTCNNQPSN